MFFPAFTSVILLYVYFRAFFGVGRWVPLEPRAICSTLAVLLFCRSLFFMCNSTRCVKCVFDRNVKKNEYSVAFQHHSLCGVFICMYAFFVIFVSYAYILTHSKTVSSKSGATYQILKPWHTVLRSRQKKNEQKNIFTKMLMRNIYITLIVIWQIILFERQRCGKWASKRASEPRSRSEVNMAY